MDKQALGIAPKKKFSIFNLVWKFEIALRMDEYYYNTHGNKLMGLYWKLRHQRLGYKLGFSIPINTIGGLRINHYGLIVVNPNARIGGEWLDIHQGVNIGENIENNSVPVIGNNVWIGPGSKIFGNIQIGNNVMIGAGAVVNRSFSEGNCRIAGVPARKINNEGNVYQR